MQQGAAIKLKTCNEMGGTQAALVARCELQQNANEGCNSCASLAGLVASFTVVVIKVLGSYSAHVLATTGAT